MIQPQVMAAHTIRVTVRVSRVAYRIWWIGLFLMHNICIVYFGCWGWIYYKLPRTPLAFNLSLYALSIGKRYYLPIAIIYWCITALHGYHLLVMISESILSRRLKFFKSPSKQTKTPSCVSSDFLACMFKPFQLIRQLVFGSLYQRWLAYFGINGMFGVGGKYFEVLFTMREITEISLMSYQAYWLSILYPRVGVNQGYVATLVLNCYATPFFHVWFRHRKDISRRRIYCQAFDMVNDIIVALILPGTLAAYFIEQFDMELLDFPSHLWYTDTFTVRAMTEFQLIFIQSPLNLLAVVFFSLSLIANMQNTKRLLIRKPRESERRLSWKKLSAVSPTKTAENRDENAVNTPESEYTQNINPGNVSIHQRISGMGKAIIALQRHHLSIQAQQQFVHKTHWLVHLLFCLWGSIILLLHIHATTQPVAPFCQSQVYPWLNSKPACTVVAYRCDDTVDLEKVLINGRFTNESQADAFEFFLSSLDNDATKMLVIRHCPSVKIPASIKRLHYLIGMKVYNSTVQSWGPDEAITNTEHPNLQYLFLINTNFTNGVLPDGLLDQNFPNQLRDIEISISNLMTLPTSIQSSWHPGTLIVMEYCQFQSFPKEILPVNAGFISMSGNRQIQVLPSELFVGTELFGVQFMDTGIQMLPELPGFTMQYSPQLYAFHVDSSKLQLLPSWITGDGGYLSRGRRISATNTPFCEVLMDLETTSGQNVIIDDEATPTNLSEFNLNAFNDNLWFALGFDSQAPLNITIILEQINCQKIPEATYYPHKVEIINDQLRNH